MPHARLSSHQKRGALILALRKAIVSEFTTEDWREFGYLSGESDFIQRHDRLLRSLHWRDCLHSMMPSI